MTLNHPDQLLTIFNLNDQLHTMIVSLALILAVQAVPEVSVSWADSRAREVDIAFSNPQLNVLECLEGGFEYRLEFALQFCRRRESWVAKCRDERTFKRSMRYDPITEQYSVSTDARNMDRESERENFVDAKRAVAEFTRIGNLKLRALGIPEALEGHTTADQFISVKARWECSGERRAVLDVVSSLLTFGLVRLSGSTSGWNYFNLGRTEAKSPK